MTAGPAWSLLVVLVSLPGSFGCSSAGDQAFLPEDGAAGALDAGTVINGDAGDDLGEDTGDDTASGGIGDPLFGDCNGLVAGDSFVPPDDSGDATAPASQGGTLVTGTYHLVSTTYYPARTCARDPLATTLQIDAASEITGTLQLASGVATGAAFTESVRYASAGNLLSTRIDCFNVDPGGVQGSAAIIAYTATPTELRLFTGTPGCGVSVDVYQP